MLHWHILGMACEPVPGYCDSDQDHPRQWDRRPDTRDKLFHFLDQMHSVRPVMYFCCMRHRWQHHKYCDNPRHGIEIYSQISKTKRIKKFYFDSLASNNSHQSLLRNIHPSSYSSGIPVAQQPVEILMAPSLFQHHCNTKYPPHYLYIQPKIRVFQEITIWIPSKNFWRTLPQTSQL